MVASAVPHFDHTGPPRAEVRVPERGCHGGSGDTHSGDGASVGGIPPSARPTRSGLRWIAGQRGGGLVCSGVSSRASWPARRTYGPPVASNPANNRIDLLRVVCALCALRVGPTPREVEVCTRLGGLVRLCQRSRPSILRCHPEFCRILRPIPKGKWPRNPAPLRLLPPELPLCCAAGRRSEER